MNSLTVKILTGLLSVLILTTIGSQIYYNLTDRHDTEEAVLTTINEDIPFQGVIVRDEKVITYDGGGVLDYTYSDGSKISVGNTIATVYSSEGAVTAKNKIKLLEEEINALERAQNPGTTNYVQPETIKSKIDGEYKELLAYSVQDNFSDFAKVREDLSLVMNIYNIVTKTEQSYDDKINELQQKVNDLESQTADSSKKITADETGYFVSYADGYESELTTENAADLTEKQIQDIIDNPAKSVDNAVGKMFTDYSCKIVGVFDNDKRITEGSWLQMTLSTTKNVYDVQVDSVKPCEDDEDKIVVTLSCDRLDEALVESRVQSAELIFDEYQGLKVPRSAIRFQGDQKGVYVILGKDITFKKIDVIYEGDDYVLSKNTSDEDYLLLYDQILLEVVSDEDVQRSKSDSKDVSSG
ncbi:HlyD family efflux transporter periplasmic adaptor subunit [Ruminococcus sp.]|uniref:HlyD family efflux transporter periplasmic adaptor subunit n=1 Tax=Ruminococcus sp. TaxID=41978 RepID=UPI0025CEB661|nr:HlyD family efflux transporter periplasmic adaptor subunit [Ruminococcus sp.]